MSPLLRRDGEHQVAASGAGFHGLAKSSAPGVGRGGPSAAERWPPHQPGCPETVTASSAELWGRPVTPFPFLSFWAPLSSTWPAAVTCRHKDQQQHHHHRLPPQRPQLPAGRSRRKLRPAGPAQGRRSRAGLAAATATAAATAAVCAGAMEEFHPHNDEVGAAALRRGGGLWAVPGRGAGPSAGQPPRPALPPPAPAWAGLWPGWGRAGSGAGACALAGTGRLKAIGAQVGFAQGPPVPCPSGAPGARAAPVGPPQGRAGFPGSGWGLAQLSAYLGLQLLSACASSGSWKCLQGKWKRCSEVLSSVCGHFSSITPGEKNNNECWARSALQADPRQPERRSLSLPRGPHCTL